MLSAVIMVNPPILLGHYNIVLNKEKEIKSEIWIIIRRLTEHDVVITL